MFFEMIYRSALMKRKGLKAIKVVLAVLLLSATAVNTVMAETVYTTTDLQNNKRASSYVYSTKMLEQLYAIGVSFDTKFGIQMGCTSKYSVKPMAAVVYSPIDFPEGKAHPVKGVWQVRYKLERCGEEKVYNAVFVANANGDAPTPRPYYPGATLASMVLVKDALPITIALASSRSNTKDCKDYQVFDMLLAESGKDSAAPGRPGGFWTEIWTIWLCGKRVDVPMTFTTDADGKGTSFTAGLKKGGI
jgi:hypothetical protein